LQKYVSVIRVFEQSVVDPSESSREQRHLLGRIIKANLSWSRTRAKILPVYCKFICVYIFLFCAES